MCLLGNKDDINAGGRGYMGVAYLLCGRRVLLCVVLSVLIQGGPEGL